MKSLGHTLIQYDWCPDKKRRAGYRTQQAIVKTQRVIYDPKRKVFRRNKPYLHLDLGLPAARIVRK